MSMFVFGNIATFVARGFASQSLLTGLGSVQFISNLVFVMLVLKEKVPPRCMLATLFIVVGNIVLVVFYNKDSPKYSVTELAGLYRKDGMAAYMAYAGVVIIPLLEIVWVLFIMVSGGIYFGDFEKFSTLEAAMFEAPALEEALRAAGFGQDEAGVCHNPIFVPTQDAGGSSRMTRSKSGVIPASAAHHIVVRPKKSSFAAVAQASKQAKRSVFQSAVNSVTLTAGLGTSRHLRALTIFAMPMVMPSMAEASRRQSEQGTSTRGGIDAVYNRVSRLLSMDRPVESPQPLFEPI
ncbi:hypothetical protein ABBQ32_001054 [Trebouxia sp. C0010 RCD-2024]